MKPLSRLGELSIDTFLAKTWQQQPLLIRNVFANNTNFAPLTDDEIFMLADYEDAESRLVVRRQQKWALEHGPFSASKLKTTRKDASAKWSLLIQDTQHFSNEAHDLLGMFAFLPYARIDDLMVSIANKGGGVGPHVDSYDVFLLQGSGRRRWQVSRQTDLRLREQAPLKLLRRFKPTQEWVLETGDILYLPPGVAHNGIAETDNCVTWSIGFRSPTNQEFIEAYLDHLRDHASVSGRFEDSHRGRTRAPAKIEPAIRRAYMSATAAVLREALQPSAVNNFIGCYLTAPKAHVSFSPRSHKASAAAFASRATRHGLRLALASRLLFDDRNFYLNGRVLSDLTLLDAAVAGNLKQLATQRRLAPALLNPQLTALMYQSWLDGEVDLTE